MASNSWRETTLGEFVRLQRGHDLPETDRQPGTVPIMGSAGQNGFHDIAKAKGPGVVIGRSGVGSMGVVSYCATDYWPHNTVLYVTDFLVNDVRFTYYFLHHLNLRRFDSGSAQASLNRNYIYPIRICVPGPTEQCAIAHILGTLDDKIALNRRMNETLEAMARALFRSWFVDFDPVRAKADGHDPGLPKHLADLFPDSFEDSELVEIPKGWRIGRLDEVLGELVSGARPKGGAVNEGVPSIGAENIIGLGRYDFSKEKFVPREFFEQLKIKGAAVRPGDVLLYKDGAQIGRKTYFDCDFPHAECAINEHVFILRANKPEEQRFLFFWLDQAWMTHEIISLNSNSAQPGINQPGVRRLPVLIPRYEVIEAFDQLIMRFTKRLFANCNESRTLAALRDALLPKLISGELQVKHLECHASIVDS